MKSKRKDKIVYLVSYTKSKNDIGNTIKTPVFQKCKASKESIRQDEFYQASAQGLKPELTFTIWKREYKGQLELKHKDDTYKIIRTYEVGEDIELKCSGVVNRG